MAQYVGYAGSVKLGSSSVLEINKWSLNIAQGTTETTSFGGAGWKTFKGTLREWSGSISGSLDISDTTGQNVLIESNMETQAEVATKLYLDASVYFSGNIIITNVKIDDAVEGVINVSFDYKGTGQLSKSA